MAVEYGHFSEQGERFIITNPDIPRHWYNYMWNDQYITFSSQVGFGEGFAQDAMGRRIKLVSGRNVYLLDVDSKEYWTANALPVNNGYTGYRCIHGLGYSEIQLEYQSIETSYTVFVPENANCEVWMVKMKNNRPEACTIKVIPYVKTEMDGSYQPQGYNTATGFYNAALHAVMGRSFTAFNSSESAEYYGYLTGNDCITGYDSRKNAFIGTYGHELAPAALSAGGCRNSECIAEKLCFALESTVQLESGEERELCFIAGIAFTMEELGKVRERFFSNRNWQQEYEAVQSKFAKQIRGVEIQTPDRKLNHLFNHWLKHQANMGSRWARVRHNGYRDLVSDCECLAAVNPVLAWERLKRVLSYQYSNGYAPRTFIDGSIRDHNFSDNTIWITFAVYSMLKELGDMKMLEEEVPFNDGTKSSVYEHMKRSVEFLWNFRGLHGLVKIWGGDWNDCMNKVGLKGKGTSVWLSIAWYRACVQFAEIARMTGRMQDAELAEARAAEMKELIDQYGWDGEYYLTAYTDEDVKLGSRECEEGKIFLIPQLWAVLSGVSKGNKAITAMEAVDRYLETDLGTLVSRPGYTHYVPTIGTMTQKPAGVHENGGVYLHPSSWKLAVDSLLKRNYKVQEGLEKILPFNDKWVEKKCEPYILCNSYFTKETGYRYGTSGQSWRTASGAWLLKSLVQYIFGLQPEMEGLRVNPCLPPDWKTCSIRKKFRNAMYNISYEQTAEGGCNRILEITVNNLAISSNLLPYEEHGNFDVRVVLGK